MLGHVRTDPVDPWVIANSFVVRIDHDALIPVESTKLSHFPACTLLSDALQVPGRLHLVHTMIFWFSVNDALEDHLLAASTLDAHTVDQEALLGFVPQLPCLVRTRGTGCANNCRKLPEFPGSHTTDKAHNIRLLLTPQLLKVLIGTHEFERAVSLCFLSSQILALSQNGLSQ